MKGTYIIVIFLKEKIRIKIGALGIIPFDKGFYLYIGSGMGDSGSSTLENRIKRHIQPSQKKKFHWHIDYLLNSENSILKTIFLIPFSQKIECALARDLLQVSDGFINKFGSSDCNCKSHLLYFKEFKDLSKVLQKEE